MTTNNVRVNNLCSWDLYFTRQAGIGDIKIPANAKDFPLISFEEAQVQIQTGNPMFVGTDGIGTHARIQIVDDEQRKQLFGVEGLDIEAPVQLDLTAVVELLAIRSKSKFNERLNKIVQTDAEKKVLLDLAEQAGASDGEAWKLDAIRQIASTAQI